MSASASLPPLPLIKGPWKQLTDEEKDEFLARLHHYEMMAGNEPPINKAADIRQVWALPLSFFPGWVLLQAEAVTAPNTLGTLDAVMGPDFFWKIANDFANIIHALCRGSLRRISERPEAVSSEDQHYGLQMDFFESPLTELSPEGTGNDYLQFFCQGLRASEGTFRFVQTADDLREVGVTEDVEALAQRIGPLQIEAAPPEHPKGVELVARVFMVYAGTLFEAQMEVQRSGHVEMIKDNPLVENICKPEVLDGCLRNVRTLSPAA